MADGRLSVAPRTWLGIDPGTKKSGWSIWSPVEGVIRCGVDDNEALIDLLADVPPEIDLDFSDIAIERFEARGMPLGNESIETVFWSGRFYESARKLVEPRSVRRVGRGQVKLHLCGTMRAKDANIRAVLIDRYGGSRAEAIGTKKNPGPLHGVASHMWAALAVAITAEES